MDSKSKGLEIPVGMSKAQAFRITTKKKTKLAATLYSKTESNPHLIIVSSAAGVRRSYYRYFAAYASSNKDFDVVTFDYSGIGESVQLTIVDSKSNMSEWGSVDLAAVIEWADDKYDKICLVGHSVAGQVFPKAPNQSRIFASYFVASQTPYHGYWGGFNKLKVLFFWYLILPVAVFIFDFLPSWTFGGKNPLPANVATEWRKWGTNMHGVLEGKQEVIDQFANVKIPIHFVTIGDDEMMAPSAATHALMSYYKNAKTSFQYIKPSDLSLEHIGHFGFFRKRMAKTLWPMPVFYFTQFLNKFE